MFLRFLVLFAVIALGVQSANLRTLSAEESDVPHHPDLGARIAAHFFNVTSKSVKKGKGMDLKSAKMTMLSDGGGFFVSRRRPNGDCHGPVLEEIGYGLGVCVSNPVQPTPFVFQCQNIDEHTANLKKVHFNGQNFPFRRLSIGNPGACGFPVGEEVINGNGATCQTDGTYIPYQGYTTKTANCNVQPTYMNLNQQGLLSYYGSGVCDGMPLAYRYTPFDVCQQFVDYQYSNPNPLNQGNPNSATRFYYIKMTSCDDNTGIVTVHAFSDPACSRKLYKTSFNMNANPMWHSCDYDNVMGMFGSTFCVNGFA